MGTTPQDSLAVQMKKGYQLLLNFNSSGVPIP
jgi:hypothetical protein